MESQILLAGHGLKETVQAVNHDQSRIVDVYGMTDGIDEFARAHFCRIKMLELHEPRSSKGLMSIPKPLARRISVSSVSSKMNAVVFSPRSAADLSQRMARVLLPQPAGPISNVLVPRSSPPPTKSSSSFMPLPAGGLSSESVRCSEATRRGKICNPPVRMR